MAIIKRYKKNDGTTNYMFDLYVGVNPVTGKKQRTTRRGFESEQEASIALTELQLLIATEQFTPKKSQTFTDIFSLWFKQYSKNVKESTAVTTKCEFIYSILPKFQDVKIQDITPIYCQEIVNEWYSEKPKRASRFIHYFNQIIEYAQFLEIIHYNPMTHVKKISSNVQINQYEKFNNFFSKEELTNFLSFTKSNFDTKRYTFFRTIAFTGIRKGEALALTWSDINFSEGYLEVTKTVARGKKNRLLIHPPKTQAAIRRISLDEQTLNDLMTWKNEQSHDLKSSNSINQQIIFSNHNNTYLESNIPKEWFNTIQKLYKKKTNCDLKTITIHGFRHTHASLLYEANIPTKETQERLGHANIKTTLNVYTHLSKKQNEQTATKFADFMNEK